MAFVRSGRSPRIDRFGCRAEITYMNRGHAYLERSHIPDFDAAGHALHSLAFLAYAPDGKLWSLGRGDSHGPGIRVFSGGLEGKNLVLLDGERRLGAGPLILTRLTFRPGGEGAFEVVRRDHHRPRQELRQDLGHRNEPQERRLMSAID